jgi:hypothetical protein
MITCPRCGRFYASTLPQQCSCGDLPPRASRQDTAPVLFDQPTLVLDPQLTRPVSMPSSDQHEIDGAAIWPMTPSLIFDGATHATSPYAPSYPQQPPPPPIYLLRWRTLMLHQWVATCGLVVFATLLAFGLALQAMPTHKATTTSAAHAGGALRAIAQAITSHQMSSGSATQSSPAPSIVPLRDTHHQAAHTHKHPAHGHGHHHGKHSR